MPDETANPSPACPICGRPAIAERKPFCSTRCQQVDLHRWLSGAYVVPGSTPLPDDPASDEP